MYDLEFRRRACARLINGESYNEVAKKLGIDVSSLRRWRRDYATMALTPLWKIVKCQCDSEHCNTHSIEGPVQGCFYQGCGWPKKDAEKIVAILNQHWEVQYGKI